MAEIIVWHEPDALQILARTMAVLVRGGVVACPTETFYALMVDVFQVPALQRLLEIKDRPEDKPLLVLVADRPMVGQVVETVSPLAEDLMASFWPGPLTLILPARVGLPRPLTGGSGTIGVRQSGHLLPRRLCAFYGHPLTGTSANRSGRPPLTTSVQVDAELGEAVDLIVEAGPCPGGLPSTIVNVVGEPPRLVRAGAIPADVLSERLGRLCR